MFHRKCNYCLKKRNFGLNQQQYITEKINYIYYADIFEITFLPPLVQVMRFFIRTSVREFVCLWFIWPNCALSIVPPFLIFLSIEQIETKLFTDYI